MEEREKRNVFVFYFSFSFGGRWLGRRRRHDERGERKRNVALFLTNDDEKRNGNCTQVHVGTTARQGRLRKRECFLFSFAFVFVSRFVGGGGGEEKEKKEGWSSFFPVTQNPKKKLSIIKTPQVRVVTDKRSGTEFAAKSIPKRLDAPGLAPERQAAHVDNIRREVAVLRRLRGTLNVVALEGAFEDAESVHIVMVRFVRMLFLKPERDHERERERESGGIEETNSLTSFFLFLLLFRKNLHRSSAAAASSSTPSPTARTTPR